MRVVCTHLLILLVLLSLCVSATAAEDYDLRVTIAGQGTVFEQATPVAVAVDIRPGQCPNRLDVSDTGRLPVAILGSSTFDVRTVDRTSIRLQGVAPTLTRVDDVATPVTDSLEPCACTTQGADGYPDLTFQVRVRDIIAALGQVTDGDLIPLSLTGTLLRWYGGAPIEGSDCVLIQGSASPPAAQARVMITPSVILRSALDRPAYSRIRCDIMLTHGYDVDTIDVSTVRLNDTFAPVDARFRDNIVLSVWFQTSQLADLLTPGSVKLTITGKLNNGVPFEGTSSIWVW